MATRFPKGHRGKRRRRAILVVTPEGKIQFSEPAARRWLKQFFGRPTRARTLPRRVCRWVSNDNRTRKPLLLVAKTANAQLYVKREPFRTDDDIILLFELIKKQSGQHCRWHLELTPREREVLFWVARGKSNPAIGSILGIAASTVGKHLERIYAKLGLENRVALSRFCFEMCPTHCPSK